MNFFLYNLDWLAGGSELIGSWLVGSKRRLGFLINMACCLTWMVVAVNREVYGLLLVVVPVFFINIRNYHRWRKTDRGLKKAIKSATELIKISSDLAKQSVSGRFSKGSS